MLTSRLKLREWRDEDLEPFAALNADPRVMEFLPGPLSREESDAMVERIRGHFAEHGFGLWAAELREESKFIGFIGLNVPKFEAHFTPCVEVGWRLAAEYWGWGYAPEGARGALEYGFRELGLEEIVAITVPHNLKSRRVMEKIGMRHDPVGDFSHPNLPEESPLKQHVLYRIGRGGLERGDPSGNFLR